jgi:hypothetical protein
LNIELNLWENYGVTHPPSSIYWTDFKKIFEEYIKDTQSIPDPFNDAESSIYNNSNFQLWYILTYFCFLNLFQIKYVVLNALQVIQQ